MIYNYTAVSSSLGRGTHYY